MPRRVEVSASIHNLPPAAAVMAGVGYHERFLDVAGYEGYQYAYVRNTHGNMGAALARRKRVLSLHQAFVAGKGMKDAVLAAVLGRPENSLDKLARVQRAAGELLPLVAHPNEQHHGGNPYIESIDYRKINHKGRFATLLHQPTVEVMRAWGVLARNHPEQTARDMLEAQEAHGFSEVALDLHHLTANRGGEQLPLDWCVQFAGELAAVGALGGPAEVQLAFRPDFGDGLTNLKFALEGRFNETPHGIIMNAIAEKLPADQQKIRANIETPSSGFDQLGISWLEGNRQLVSLARASLAAS